MRYLSTRSPAASRSFLDFEDVLLTGLAPDGGLYVPDMWPTFSAAQIRALRGLPYAAIGAAVVAPLVGDMLTRGELETLFTESYTGFGHEAVAPLQQIGSGEWLLELFHGPTLAFKDYALQALGRLFDAILTRRSRRVTIVGATSGDTGSAAIEAFRDRDNVDIFILYPAGRPSDVQRRQMTTVAAANTHTLAIDGSFDDCQDLVKALFADQAFRDGYGLAAVNSINWARIAAQIIYYFAAATALGSPDIEVSFAVPTGNFGNVYAGHVARRMGLPIRDLIVGTNRNDILHRFIQTGEMRIAAVEPSLSPSMDIQVSSNFERLYFELRERDGAAVAEAMASFRKTGTLPADDQVWRAACEGFKSFRVDDALTKATITAHFARTGGLLDPHSAVAVAAMRGCKGDPAIPHIALACAHAAKFPEIVETLTGIHPPLPPALADLMIRPEHINPLPNDFGAVRDFIAARARRAA